MALRIDMEKLIAAAVVILAAILTFLVVMNLGGCEVLRGPEGQKAISDIGGAAGVLVPPPWNILAMPVAAILGALLKKKDE